MKSYKSSFIFFNIFAYSIILICLLDVILYSSYFYTYISLATVSFLLILFFFFRTVNNVVYSLSFLILILTFYLFTIAPYTADLEENAFFILGPLLFLMLIVLFTSNFSEVNIHFTFFDNLLLGIAFISILLSNTIINPKELEEPQSILKMITVIGSLIIFTKYFASFFYEDINLFAFVSKVIVYIGIASAIFGIMTIFDPGLNANNSQFPGHAISFYKHPNATSSIYNFSIPISLWLLLYRRNKISLIERFIFFMGILISFSALFFTYSRFGIVTVIVSALILIYKYSRKLFIGIAFFGLLISSYLIASFFSTKGSITILGRIGLLQTTFKMFSNEINLLFGYGGISTHSVFEEVKSSLGVLDPNNSPHNIILYSILLYGLIFTISLFIIFLKYYFKSMLNFFKKKVSDMFILSFSIVTGIFLKNMGEDLLFFQEFFMWYLFLIFFGFLIIENNTIKLGLTAKADFK